MIFRRITLDTTLGHVWRHRPPAAPHILAAHPLLGTEFAETSVGLAYLGAALDRLAARELGGKILINPGA
ncbi:hypothetical protein ACFWFQ_14070 [Nocardia salmonicida]|uniref:hypothetical protein n=1 Tax=Nocardia salmonicida TaxID=53431 RepID=UPI00365BA26A